MTTIALPFTIAKEVAQSSASRGVNIGVSHTATSPILFTGGGAIMAIGVAIPERERWLWGNIGALVAVTDGIADAAAGRVQERSFAEFAKADDA